VKEVSGVVHLLTQSAPSIQKSTLETYFTPNASFTHPFCRTGSFDGSRWFIWAIFRWYKIMSPHIDLEVKSVAYDEQNLRLYVGIYQVFRIWLFPGYKAPVNLVTVLQLEHDKQRQKYYITSQNDLYQVNEFVRFVWPGGFIVVWLWQVIATLVSTLGALFLWPITWIEDNILPKQE